MQRPVFAANWKLNHGPTEARAFMAAFLARYTPRTDRTVAIFPPALSFTACREARGQRSDILLGVQNIYSQPTGAFTGENSALIARDAGAQVVLVGHSERRHLFGETDAESGRKCAVVLANQLMPLLCVGELLSEREEGRTEQVVLSQMEAALSQIQAGDIAKLVIAYEPVWAIGTGKTATPQDASSVHSVLRRDLAARVGERAAEIPILYGGSVNPMNAGSLLAAAEVDGLLVGGASLDPEVWSSICHTAVTRE